MLEFQFIKVLLNQALQDLHEQVPLVLNQVISLRASVLLTLLCLLFDLFHVPQEIVRFCFVFELDSKEIHVLITSFGRQNLKVRT